LWGHSQEIDARGHWSKLENVLIYIAGRKNIRYLTNAEILMIPKKKTMKKRVINIAMASMITPNYRNTNPEVKPGKKYQISRLFRKPK
jgi:hypothetical protein